MRYRARFRNDVAPPDVTTRPWSTTIAPGSSLTSGYRCRNASCRQGDCSPDGVGLAGEIVQEATQTVVVEKHGGDTEELLEGG